MPFTNPKSGNLAVNNAYFSVKSSLYAGLTFADALDSWKTTTVNCPPQLITMGSYKFINTTNGHEITDVSKYLGTNTTGEILTNALYGLKFPGQRAIFKYPSNIHPGAFEGWFFDTNTSVTKTLD